MAILLKTFHVDTLLMKFNIIMKVPCCGLVELRMIFLDFWSTFLVFPFQKHLLICLLALLDLGNYLFVGIFYFSFQKIVPYRNRISMVFVAHPYKYAPCTQFLKINNTALLLNALWFSLSKWWIPGNDNVEHLKGISWWSRQ